MKCEMFLCNLEFFLSFLQPSMSHVGMHPGVFYGGRMLSSRQADSLATEKANKEAEKDTKKGHPRN